MRAYNAENLEALRARDLIQDWAGEGFIADGQRQRMQEETPSGLRRTNIFLRLVMFFFAMIVIAAVIGFFYFTSSPPVSALLIFAAAAYGAAEFAAAQGFYRHGIEEASAFTSVLLLGIGLYATLDSSAGMRERGLEFCVPLTCAMVSLWIWYRFGLAYMFLIAMLFLSWLAGLWANSLSAQHLISAAFFAIGIVGVAILRVRHRLDYLNRGYAIAEALLWLGFYLTWNLQINWMHLLREMWDGPRNTDDFSRAFYWTTYLMTWLIPPVALYRGIRIKDRFVMGAGGVAAIATLMTNKLYLGWERHTWDLITFGATLIAVALLLQRWLNKGENGVRHGFTAKRLSGKDKGRMGVVSTAFGLAAGQTAAVTPKDADFHFGGGSSGGGGASGEF